MQKVTKTEAKKYFASHQFNLLTHWRGEQYGGLREVVQVQRDVIVMKTASGEQSELRLAGKEFYRDGNDLLVRLSGNGCYDCRYSPR